MTTKERTRLLGMRAIIQEMAGSYDNMTVYDYPELFEAWKPDTDYKTGTRLAYNGVVYNVLQDHTSQSDWTPEAAPSLFAKVLNPDPDVIPEWEQPDSTNAYNTGDKVMYNGKVYKSLIDNNVWSPEAYPAGWEEVA